MEDKKEESWVLYVGTFPPRECGIATFTKDLTTAMDKQFSPFVKTKIVAMNHNVTNAYNYPEDVILQINDADIREYIDAAEKINCIDKIKLISIQHEFGIFGGEYGSHLVSFLERIDKPVVITFHSVLSNPNKRLKRVVQALAEKSECIIVMAQAGESILRGKYRIKTDIRVIPHGIPDIEFISSIKEKTRKGYSDKIILSSFGMMSPGKGYEYVIDALPGVVKEFPDILYLIIGETHPIVRKKEGEQYRNFLEEKVNELKLEKHVKFYNKYITSNEIKEYLQATDLFICSNINPEQVTSGVLAYAAGAGRAIVSTSFLHARGLITPEMGKLVRFRNSKSFENAIIKVLSDPELKKRMEENAYANTRHMTWDNVACAYNSFFAKYICPPYEKITTVPNIDLDYMDNLTGDFNNVSFAGMAQPVASSGCVLEEDTKAALVCSIQSNILALDSKTIPIRK